MSNDPVGYASQPVTVVLTGASGTLATVQATTSSAGLVSVPDNASATSIQVTDGYGNVATASL